MSLLRRLGFQLQATRTSPVCAPPLARLYSDWREQTATKWGSEEELEEARHWIEKFKVEDIPRKCCTVTYASSSGPGGQNVNKLATKATLHLKLNEDAKKFLPEYVLRKVRENSKAVTKNDEIVLQADESRKQTENSDAVYRRLHSILVDAVRMDVPGVTSAEQHKRVLKLQQQDANLRKKLKTFQKDKKASRRSKGGDD
ncbi:hypothetical protein FPQ18DRAFT_379342 [Pyronema domesticum]|uniref:Prokaryotic-type class I peptide chain release factors domain-containing protein n=1 Tax=Pyronema omphalodes (strain CBS 100304) TaxID=1076935 RepID=U4LNZ8_PYROM|nr:hypothetical protein FPQ18DRAFT_379342 [Pyronema domesticum]CCX33282.1 Similar to Putative uncharacterized protein YOL114C; acc. no. Q12322 [Pyronema omphalodes CBS 100304]